MKNAITPSLIVAMITILLVSCEPVGSPKPAKTIEIRTTILNHKSDSIYVKLVHERYYGGLVSSTSYYRQASGEKNTLIEQMNAYQRASYYNTYYITDANGKKDTIRRTIDLSEKEYHPKISETIVITD